jgi:hypothetical protein
MVEGLKLHMPRDGAIIFRDLVGEVGVVRPCGQLSPRAGDRRHRRQALRLVRRDYGGQTAQARPAINSTNAGQHARTCRSS